MSTLANEEVKPPPPAYAENPPPAEAGACVGVADTAVDAGVELADVLEVPLKVLPNVGLPPSIDGWPKVGVVAPDGVADPDADAMVFGGAKALKAFGVDDVFTVEAD